MKRNKIKLPAFLPKNSFFFKSLIISSNFILNTLHTMSGLSDIVHLLEETKSRILGQFTLHVIVINKFGYPNFLHMAISYWQLLNI